MYDSLFFKRNCCSYFFIFCFPRKMYFYRLKFYTMALKDILVISGQGGLFRYISQGRNNVIVENLTDHKRTTIPASAKISMLDDISIFAENEDVPLRKVFKKIQEKENGEVTIPHKSSDAELKKYFNEILPEYDKDRVYVSDIRKVVMWYNLLHEMGITDFEIPDEEKEDEISEEMKEEVSEDAGEVSEDAGELSEEAKKEIETATEK